MAQGATAGREPLAGRPLPALAEALARTLAGVEAGAVGGDGEGLRRAVADLGVGLEARLARGSVPDAPPLRALALAIAQHAAAEPALARAAGAVADGIAAQPLAGALPLPAPAAATADPTAGAYLQVPLPGGSTAEIRVRPDAGRDDGGEGRDRPRMLAFLLHLSSLGPVLIEASAGPGGVEATVKAGSDAAREHLARHAAELTDGLRRAAPSARVRVERMDGPAPERLIDPPPASGLDARA